jgi:phenylacetic acid degradation operon negative regulatory protein
MFGPRSAMLTLYGDYVRHRGGEIGIGSLIALLNNFGLSENSIRSAVSRMCRAGILKVRRNKSRSYYSLSNEGLALMNKGERRIFERKRAKWDGLWNLVVYYIPEENREARDRLRRELAWMGFGPLTTATWISPHDLTDEVSELADKLKIQPYIQIFQTRMKNSNDPAEIVARCWDLQKIHKRYSTFIKEYRKKMVDHQTRIDEGEIIESSEYFVQRFKLIDDYRRLPYLDPDLPEELLPKNWLRSEAMDLFDQYHGMLTEKANQYFDSVLAEY